MFEEIFDKYSWENVSERIYNSAEDHVIQAISKEDRTPDDFYALVSPSADAYLEELAHESFRITRMRFGNTIQLYAPLYVSNECSNSCLYCGFSIRNKIKRLTLTEEEAGKESSILYNTGFRHILLVSGEHRKAVPPESLSAIASSIHSKFASVSIEVYPMETEEYIMMERSGIDGLTLYQETYDRNTYSEVHPAGKKRDFSWRLHGPERGGDAGFRKIGIGALLGLSDWRVDGFFTALHAYYLSKKYWKSQIQVSFPRLRKAEGRYMPPHPVSDRDMTHLICAMRIFLPDAGLALSTREAPYFRDNIMPLGITMMSAGSRTEPGGYGLNKTAGRQFEIEDSRPPETVVKIISQKGFDPVWKDWDRKFLNRINP